MDLVEIFNTIIYDNSFSTRSYMEECVIDKDKSIFETLPKMNIKNFGDVCSKESQQFNQDQPVET
jgi:hypothetical protein